ncbi:hypothetical protein OAL97_04955, partial [Paracoccaceae bacterium]|nr:hypothetical protein [Paracoccaceae bacterium]
WQVESARYFNPYFVENLNNRSLEMLTDLDFEDYFVWRIDYWVSDAGKEKIKSQKNLSTSQITRRALETYAILRMIITVGLRRISMILPVKI